MNHDTETTARTLVADGKGILADDETPGTLTKRFSTRSASGPPSRAVARIGKYSSRRRTPPPPSAA
jgi:hypothetical protein